LNIENLQIRIFNIQRSILNFQVEENLTFHDFKPLFVSILM